MIANVINSLYLVVGICFCIGFLIFGGGISIAMANSGYNDGLSRRLGMFFSFPMLVVGLYFMSLVLLNR